MPSRDEITRRYQNDIEAAQAWRESDPERYNQEIAKAQDRRADALAELITEAETRATASALAASMTEARAKYPLAPQSLISGNTPEAILDSAKALHELADTARKQGEEAARASSRATRAAAYDRAGGIPAGSGRPADAQDHTREQAQSAVDRINTMKAESGKNGDKRDPTKILSIEDTLQAMRESGKTDHLVNIMTGSAAATPQDTGRLSEEDLKG